MAGVSMCEAGGGSCLHLHQVRAQRPAVGPGDPPVKPMCGTCEGALQLHTSVVLGKDILLTVSIHHKLSASHCRVQSHRRELNCDVHRVQWQARYGRRTCSDFSLREKHEPRHNQLGQSHHWHAGVPCQTVFAAPCWPGCYSSPASALQRSSTGVQRSYMLELSDCRQQRPYWH